MAQLAIIDLYPSETEADGTHNFRPPLQALASQIAGGAIWLAAEYPQETFQTLMLASIVGLCVWCCKWK
jgi:hypothetical protein